MIDVDRLPSDIRESDRGVVWRYEERGGKRTKVPYVATRPTERAAVDDPATWSPFTEAVDSYHDGKADGAGIVLGDGRAGVDIDDCRDPDNGVIEAWALEIIRELNSYTEVSPSGRGVKIFVRGTLPRGRRRKGNIEMYSELRYFTVTAEHLEGTPTTIEERTAELARLHARIFATNGGGEKKRETRRATQGLDLNDQDLLARARNAANGSKFTALWNGETAGYASASEADQALANLLAFWTGADSARMDRLFRQSELFREKWDERRGENTYGERTIKTAIANCRETYHGDNGHATVEIVEDEADEPPAPEQSKPYTFEAVLPAEHFIGRWLSYATSRTDAAHEYHEAAALVLLASATPTVRARLAPYPNGLPTNLYVLIVGDSTTSRKSTSKDIARDVQYRALHGSLSPDHFSPEGFVEHLAHRPHDTTTLYVDEFGELLEKLHHAHHMAGLRGLLMTIYAGDDYSYRRHSKRHKGGAAVEDEDRVIGPHLSILGATTPAVFELLTDKDVTSGLLPRFAIIFPTGKPPRRPFHQVSETLDSERNALVLQLGQLHAWATDKTRIVRFAPDVLDRLDNFFESEFDAKVSDRSETGRRMLERLQAMTLKVAMLIGAGWPESTGRNELEVRDEDATAAVTIVRRWQTDAIAFAGRIGESDFERKLQTCLRLVQARRRVPRRTVARNCHTDKKTLDMIQDTLVDRGNIRLISTGPSEGGGRALIEWELTT